MDAGKPLNPAAIAASGAISAIPGTAAAKVPLSALGRIGTGLATGYASDIANRGIQQLGDTGRINPNTLDYRPGLGTVIGGTAGVFSKATASVQPMWEIEDLQSYLQKEGTTIEKLWATGKEENALQSLTDHANRHASKFGLKAGDMQYGKMALAFKENPPKGTKAFYLPKTKQTVYFQPISKLALFMRQDGKIQSFYPKENAQDWFKLLKTEAEYKGKFQ